MTRPTLVEFLTARLDDWEAFVESTPGEVEWVGGRLVDPRPMMLADVRARRAIVTDYRRAWYIEQGSVARVNQRPPAELGERTLRHLASVYADHPDYDATWAP